MMEVMAYALFGIGAILMLISILGLYRFPDVFTRSHAASIIDTGSISCVLLACVLLTGLSLVTIKIIFIWIFVMITSPTATHALLKAAIADGMRPASWAPESTNDAPSATDQNNGTTADHDYIAPSASTKEDV